MVENTAKLPIQVPLPLPPEDVKWSSVSLSEILDRGTRLEASIYDIEGKHAREVLSRCKYEIVNLWSEDGLIKTASYPTRFKRIYVGRNGIPFFLPSQLNELRPKPTKFISPKTNTDFESLKVKENEILLTRSGTVGNCTLASKTLEGKVFSDDVIRLRVKNPSDAGYIYAFFKTGIGQTLIQTNNYGAVISHIEPEHLTDIPIPNPSPIIKSTIHNLVIKSFDLRDESNGLINEAENLLINELHLPPIEQLKTKQFDKSAEYQNHVVRLSELNGRFESTYHKPLVRAIVDHISKHAAEVTEVGNARISKGVLLPGRFKRVYVEEGQGIVFFGGKELLHLNPQGEKFLSLERHGGRINDELQLQENTILITRSGTIGKVNIVPKHWEGWVANEHVIRVIPTNKKLAGYIYAWLTSDYGYELIRRFSYGAVVDEIDNNHVARVQIPLLKDQGIQDKINNLILEANRKRYEAYLLEQEAIQAVNKQVIFAEK